MANKRSLKLSPEDVLFLSYRVPEQGWRARWEPRWFQLLLWANGVDPLVYRYLQGEDFRSMSERARKDPGFFPDDTTESRKKIALMLKLAIEMDQLKTQYSCRETKKTQIGADLVTAKLPIANQLHALFHAYAWERKVGIAIDGRGPQPYIRTVVRDDGTIPEGERLAVEALADCAHSGLLSRLKVCECGCGLWFFETRMGKRFFSNACRRRAAQSAPEYRESRRKYAKEYYEAQLKGLRKRNGTSKEKRRKKSVAQKTR